MRYIIGCHASLQCNQATNYKIRHILKPEQYRESLKVKYAKLALPNGINKQIYTQYI